MQLAKALDISYPTLFRVSQELIPVSTELAERVLTLAKTKGVASPLGPAPKQPSPGKLTKEDYEILELLGASLNEDKKVSQELLGTLARNMGEKNLIKLAESDDATPNVHLAVAKLLGL